MKFKKIIIIGAGAAGCFAAIHNKLTNPTASVTILEKSRSILNKVKISGGGRCNVTHACFEPKDLIEYYPRGKKELLSCFTKFQPLDTIQWFETEGVPLKTEKDGRIFPKSNSSQTIIDCLLNKIKQLGIHIQTHVSIETIKKVNDHFVIDIHQKPQLICDKLILATGSNPFGYKVAQELGHTIEKPIPSLFTFKINDPLLTQLNGASVANTICTLNKTKKFSQTGPVLITHWGLSGPAIIKSSAVHAKLLHENNYQLPLSINWLPEKTTEDISTTLKKTQLNHPKKQLQTQTPFTEIPLRLWQFLIKKCNIQPNQTWQSLSIKQCQLIAERFTNTTFQLSGKGVFKEEFVTCGGVTLNEINFSNMESKICKNLHVIGELLNIDGLTGGFNFQNAWTTSFLSST